MNMAEIKDELLLSGWQHYETHRNGWITYCRKYREGSTYYDPEWHFCTLFTNGRIAQHIIRPKKRR